MRGDLAVLAGYELAKLSAWRLLEYLIHNVELELLRTDKMVSMLVMAKLLGDRSIAE